MPPRKSTDSMASAQPKGGEGIEAQGQGKQRQRANSDSLGVEDLNLPRSMVQRLAKGVLPPNTSIQREALLAMSKSATIFVNYLANNANDRAVLKNKKTIQPTDVFDALEELEFPDFLPRVKTELEIWNTAQCDKRNSYRRRIREEAAAKDGGPAEATNGQNGDASATNGTHRPDGSPPAIKKLRLSMGTATNGDDDAMDEQDDGDDTIDENEVEEEDVPEDEDDIEDEPVDVEDAEEGLEGDLDHHIQDDEGNDSD